MGAGGGGIGGPGLCFIPRDGETEQVVIREQGDVKHVCVRDNNYGESHVYIIVATVKKQWLANKIAKLVRENPDKNWT